MVNVKKGRVTLDRALSKLGFASRTEAHALILAGKVKVHSSVETNPQRRVNPDTAYIEVEGEKALKGVTQLLMLHKPKNCVTTKRDPEGRKTVYDYLPLEMQSLHAIGRLDLQTTGLLLLTNDTRLSNALTDPENKIKRTYEVQVRNKFSEANRLSALAGISDLGQILIASELTILASNNRESRLEITLEEGKNREIRRLCLNLGHEVTALKRTAFGNYHLGDLKLGEIKWIEVIK